MKVLDFFKQTRYLLTNLVKRDVAGSNILLMVVVLSDSPDSRFKRFFIFPWFRHFEDMETPFKQHLTVDGESGKTVRLFRKVKERFAMLYHIPVQQSGN